MKHLYNLRWELALAASFVLPVGAGVLFGLMGHFWLSAVTWCAFGYVVVTVFRIVQHRRYSIRNRPGQIFTNLACTIFWPTAMVMWADNEIEFRSR